MKLRRILTAIVVAFVCVGSVATYAYEPDESTTRTTKNRSNKKKSSKTSSKSSKKSNSSEASKAGPAWLNGTWKCTGSVRTGFGTIKANATLYINTSTRQIVAVDGGSTVSKGTYYVENGTIYAPSQLYINIDSSNQRLEYGSGLYYTKTSNTSYLGN